LNLKQHEGEHELSRDQDFTRKCSYTNRIRWDNYVASITNFIAYKMCQNYESWLACNKFSL